MIIAFTGHRPNKLGSDYALTGPKVVQIKRDLINNLSQFPAVSGFIVGGALGVDTLAALIAQEYRIPYVVAVPCAGQESKWNPACRNRYIDILEGASKVHYVSSKPYDSICMQKRNEWMVDNCDILYAVWDGSDGGTSNCIKYAQKCNKLILMHLI